jgi:hypothetical protein
LLQFIDARIFESRQRVNTVKIIFGKLVFLFIGGYIMGTILLIVLILLLLGALPVWPYSRSWGYGGSGLLGLLLLLVIIGLLLGWF